MTDNTSPNPEQPDGDAGASGAPDGDPKPVHDDRTKAEIAKAARRRDEALKRAEKAEARATELETSLAELRSQVEEFQSAREAADNESAKKQGDIEKIQKSFEAKEQKLLKQIDELKKSSETTVGEWKQKYDTLHKKLYTSFVERTLLEELSAHSTNAKAMLVQLKAEFEFEPEEDEDGNFVGVVAKGSMKSIQELHDELCDRLNLPFKKNPRQGGTGTPPAKPSPNGTKTSGIPADIASGTATPERRRQWMAENPELALEVATQSLRR